MKRFKDLKIAVGIVLVLIIGVCCKNEGKTEVTETKNVKHSESAGNQNCDADFDVFFEKFSIDSIYQNLHVKFPLKNTYLNSSGDYEEMVEYIKPGDYGFSDFHKDGDVIDIENGKFTVSVRKEKDSVFYQQKGIDNGIFTIAKFVFENGCWYLVTVEDSST